MTDTSGAQRAKREVILRTECAWCGEDIPALQIQAGETWFDQHENEFFSEMCLGQFEAGRQF